MIMKRHMTVNCKKQPIRNDDPGFSISSVKPEYPVENIKLRTKRKPNYKYQSEENESYMQLMEVLRLRAKIKNKKKKSSR